MYCSLGQNQFFDDAGAPLSAGRVKIYAKGSDTLLPIYEDNGDGFVPAQNPVITANDGRIQTIFWPAALVDVVVEKSNGDGTYTELDSFVAGLDLSSVDAIQGVGSITELRSIAPSENMVVQVNGYYVSGDCPTRKYIWCTGAANTDDGGYIIASNVDAGGRWLMLWDDTEFLPASLYGVMVGYSGYAKTSNIDNFAAVGNTVLAGNVLVNVPPVLLFDGRQAQPVSASPAPVAYYYNGTLTTIHYVACARGISFNVSGGQPTIHCAGVRGESYETAYWLVDQNYTSKDPMERISSLMFYGNTQAMHDAFMACVACAKVKFVELYEGGVYNTLTSSDSFSGKVVVDYKSTDLTPPVYNQDLNTTIIEPNRNRVTSYSILADTFEMLRGIRFQGSQTNCMEAPVSGTGYYPNAPRFPHGFYVEGAINASTISDDLKKFHVSVAPTSGTSLYLTMDTSTGNEFYNSKYKVNDMIVVSNKGSANLNVVLDENPYRAATLLPNESCWFIKAYPSAWHKVCI